MAMKGTSDWAFDAKDTKAAANLAQMEYLDQEKRAAQELLKIQSKNAEDLAKLRLKLLEQLSNEALEEGQTVEEYLAQYGLQQRLSALASELEARRRGEEGHLDDLLAAQELSNKLLFASESKLASIRQRRIATESKQQLLQLKKASKTEQKLNETNLKHQAALDKKYEAAEEALDSEAEISLEKIRIESLKAIELIEQNIINLRLGSEDEIFAKRFALLAQMSKLENASTPESDLSTDSSDKKTGKKSETPDSVPAPITVEPTPNVSKSTEADTLEFEQPDLDLPDPEGINKPLLSFEDRARAMLVRRYAEEEEAIRKNAALTTEEQDRFIAQLKHQFDFYDQAVLENSNLLADSTDAQLASNEEIYEARMTALLDLSDVEASQEEEQFNKKLDNLYAYNRLRKKFSIKEEDADEDIALARGIGTRDEIIKEQTPQADPQAALGLFREGLEKMVADRDKQIAAEKAAADQRLAQQMQGLWNMGHSLEEITKYATFEDEESANQAISEQIGAEKNETIMQIQAADAVAQAKEIADLIAQAYAEGQQPDEEAIAKEVAERHRLTMDAEKARLDEEFAIKEKSERDIAKKVIQDKQKAAKAQEKLDKKKEKENTKFGQSKVGKGISTLKTLANPMGEMKDMLDSGVDPEEAKKAAQEKLNAAFEAVGNWVNQLAAKGKVASDKQAAIDTRLQGSRTNELKMGSYWRKLDTLISEGVGVSPFVRQENVAASIEKLVGQGISYNVKQRAFLDTISEKIANTFNAADGTLLKLVRIQQADTTAARLGMESALTAFLNSMYETSEFMQDTATSIRQSLYEATALMGAEEATNYEFQVQKWLGSLYSVGFSASDKIAEALGKLTAGDISGITEGTMGNLLVMAANEASLSVGEILEKGLSADETDRLMESMVRYLSRIYSETKESRVLAQQYGSVFGVTAADLKAVSNLTEQDLKAIAKKDVEHKDMLNRLTLMANTMAMRTSTNELFDNIKENFSYTMATTLANNPVLSGLNNMANMLNDLVGGIEIPFVNVYGFGFDLNATVADLMNVAALSGSVLGGMGKMLSSLTSGGGFSGSGMLNRFGIDTKGGAAKLTRGSAGLDLTAMGNMSTSESGMVGNESGEDVKNKTIQDNSEEPEKQIAEAKEEQEDKENARTALIDGHIVDIYNLLTEVTVGAKKWHVKLEVGNNPTSWSPGTWT